MCLILVIVLAISAATLADIASETNTKAEQHFEKANELLKHTEYEAAIAEYKKVINISSNSKIAQNAQYWIGQSHFRAGQFDAAQETFAKLIEAYPTSAIVPVTKLMVERVGQAKENEEIRRVMSNATDKGVIVDPKTGVKYTKTRTFAGKRDVIEYTTDLNLSPNGKFLLNWNLVVPLDSGDPFELVDMPAGRGTWSPDGKKAAFYSEGGIWVIPVSPETGQSTGPPKKLIDGKYRFQINVNWSPDSKKLTFERYDEENIGDIWTLSVKTSSLTRITSDPGKEYAPVWSPDGKTIAYGKGYPPSIWLSPAEGGTARKIIDHGGMKINFWSPDGKWIVSGNVHLFRIADNQKLEIIPPREVGSFFSWSPDGKKMLFYRPSYDDKETLKVVSASGGPHLELGRPLTFWGGARWSPDSKMIIVVGENNEGDIVYWIVPLSGADPFLLEMDVSVDGKPFPFSVFPDVKKLAFSVRRDDGVEDLFVVPISLKDARTTGPAIKVFDGWYRNAASWSPDGSKLAVIYKGDVWIASTNGDKPVQLTKTPEEERWPGWSPDGKMLSYQIFYSTGKQSLHVIPASGGKEIKRLEAFDNFEWSPDGKEFAVAFKNDQLSVISIASGKTRRIADLKDMGLIGVNDLSWSPDGKEIAVAFKNDQLSVISIASGKTRRIADLKDMGLIGVNDLSWSPDGRNIAFIGHYTEKEESRPIFVIPMAGGKANEIATDDNSWKYSLDWSPDSKWISYSSDESVKTRPRGSMWEADFEEIVKKASR